MIWVGPTWSQGPLDVEVGGGEGGGVRDAGLPALKTEEAATRGRRGAACGSWQRRGSGFTPRASGQDAARPR